jgi:hypothetical protein
MKKQFFFGLVMAMICLLPTSLFAQSTEGTDFWVTLMRGDERQFDELSLTFAAKDSTDVYIENVHNDFHDTVTVGNDTIYRYKLNSIKDYCYVTDEHEEQPVYRALHISSQKPISLIAANYKNKSFDVASILPTNSLMSEYRIQCYSPYAHKDNEQGTHFAIVAAEDNVIVDYILTENSDNGKIAGTQYTTDTLKQGQVYYVWSGQNKKRDLTGTYIKARNNKKIAVFNGNSHTNIPGKEDRDHIFSQAMPINYWGKRFAITSSLTTIDNQEDKIKNGAPNPKYKKLDGYWERIDKIRVLALVDGTVVKVDGDSVYTFNFATNPKHYFEFDFGAKDNMTQYSGTSGIPYYEGASHYVETTCPSAVHLFMTSNRYDHGEKEITEDGVKTKYKYCNGDPSLIWVNPIEQKIDTLTFGTFKTQQVTDHFINIVTTADNVKSVILDGDSIYKMFSPLNGNADYMFARITGVEDRAHTLTSDSGFIAHVYGFGQRESYGYPAGGRTNDLTAFITINGEIYRVDGNNKPICGDDTIHFGAELKYEYDSIYWNFDDGQDTITYPGTDSLPHFYKIASVYPRAYALIYRHMNEDDECINLTAYDSIPFVVNVGSYKIEIDSVIMPQCTQQGDVVDLTVYLSNPAMVSLQQNDSVKITFNDAAKAAGFDENSIRYQGDTIMIFRVPAAAKEGEKYGLHIHIGSECPNATLDKDTVFQLWYEKPYLEQRYNNVLGLIKDSFPNQTLSDFHWYHDGVMIPNEESSVITLEENESNNGQYHVCFTVHKQGKDTMICTCPIPFTASTKKHEFESNTDSLKITATYIVDGQKVFVNSDWQGKTDIECYAQWITPSGNAYQGLKFDIPDGGCTIPVPAENGFYILRVVTDGSKRSFKFIINH